MRLPLWIQIMRLIAVFVLSTLTCSAATAQSWFPDLAVNQLWTLDHSEEIERTISSNSAPANVSNPAQLTFTPSSARTKANVAAILAQISASNPAAASDLQQQFASTDVIAAVRQQLGSVGLNPNNTADAFAVWWVVAWSAANATESPDESATYQAVSRQARSAMAAMPGAAALSNEQKQQFAEELMIQAAILDGMNDQFRNDPQNKAQMIKSARDAAAQYGFDVNTMTLTPQGFRPRQGAALDPAAVGEADPQLAAAAAQEAGAGEENTLATYAAIAAAAGAGLAGAYWLGKAGRG